jgi:hypothetical protein
VRHHAQTYRHPVSGCVTWLGPIPTIQPVRARDHRASAQRPRIETTAQ